MSLLELEWKICIKSLISILCKKMFTTPYNIPRCQIIMRRYVFLGDNQCRRHSKYTFNIFFCQTSIVVQINHHGLYKYVIFLLVLPGISVIGIDIWQIRKTNKKKTHVFRLYYSGFILLVEVNCFYVEKSERINRSKLCFWNSTH